jgi:hypothetical protein
LEDFPHYFFWPFIWLFLKSQPEKQMFFLKLVISSIVLKTIEDMANTKKITVVSQVLVQYMNFSSTLDILTSTCETEVIEIQYHFLHFFNLLKEKLGEIFYLKENSSLHFKNPGVEVGLTGKSVPFIFWMLQYQKINPSKRNSFLLEKVMEIAKKLVDKALVEVSKTGRTYVTISELKLLQVASQKHCPNFNTFFSAILEKLKLLFQMKGIYVLITLDKVFHLKGINLRALFDFYHHVLAGAKTPYGIGRDHDISSLVIWNGSSPKIYFPLGGTPYLGNTSQLREYVLAILC